MDASGRPEAAPPPGSARDLGAAVLALLGTRVELAGVELREESLRLTRFVVLAVVAALLLAAALVLFGVWVAAFFWDTHRLLALGLVVAAYAAIAVGILLRIKAAATGGPMPFAATVRELQEDAAEMKARHE